MLNKLIIRQIYCYYSNELDILSIGFVSSFEYAFKDIFHQSICCMGEGPWERNQ